MEFVAEHCSHRPATHAGSAPVGHASVADDPASPLHAVQVEFAGSQTGAAAGQSLLDEHPQVFVVRQTGVEPLHAVAFVAEQLTQRPATHAGAVTLTQGSDVPEPRSPLQARHRPVVPSQIGVVSGHCELLVQPQVLAATLQIGAVPPQALALVAEHCAQVPEPRQAGAELDGHA